MSIGSSVEIKEEEDKLVLLVGEREQVSTLAGKQFERSSEQEEFHALLTHGEQSKPATKLVAGFPLLSIFSDSTTSTVFNTSRDNFDKELVLKLFSTPLTANANERFHSVAEAAKMIDHPHIAPIYAIGISDEGCPYIVSEKAPGRTLAEIVHSDPPLSTAHISTIYCQVISALEYATTQGVAVGDLTLANIIVSGLDLGEPYVKVVGIGIHRNAFEQDISARSLILEDNAARYASPERCLGKKTDERSLVYAIGCMLHETVYRKLAFDAADPIKILFEQVNKHIMVLPTGRPEFGRIIFRALAKNPLGRYSNLTMLRHDLEAIGPAPSRTWEQMMVASSVTIWTPTVHVMVVALLALLMATNMYNSYRAKEQYLQRTVQQAVLSENLRTGSQNVEAWKRIQVLGRQLAQPTSFHAEVCMHLGAATWMEHPEEAAGYYTKAADLFHKAHLPAEELGAVRWLLNTFGQISYEPDAEERIELSRQALALIPILQRQFQLELRHQTDDPWAKRGTLTQLSDAYMSLNNWPAAEYCLLRAVHEFKEPTSSLLYWRLAECNYRQAKLTQAEYWYRRSLETQWNLTREQAARIQVALNRTLVEQGRGDPQTVLKAIAPVSAPSGDAFAAVNDTFAGASGF